MGGGGGGGGGEDANLVLSSNIHFFGLTENKNEKNLERNWICSTNQV